MCAIRYWYSDRFSGLLMGAVTNMRPDLFNSVLMGVPFVDVLTTILDETIPLTTIGKCMRVQRLDGFAVIR